MSSGGLRRIRSTFVAREEEEVIEIFEKELTRIDGIFEELCKIDHPWHEVQHHRCVEIQMAEDNMKHLVVRVEDGVVSPDLIELCVKIVQAKKYSIAVVCSSSNKTIMSCLTRRGLEMFFLPQHIFAAVKNNEPCFLDDGKNDPPNPCRHDESASSGS